MQGGQHTVAAAVAARARIVNVFFMVTVVLENVQYKNGKRRLLCDVSGQRVCVMLSVQQARAAGGVQVSECI